MHSVGRLSGTGNPEPDVTDDQHNDELQVRQILMAGSMHEDLISPTNTGLRMDPFSVFPGDNSRRAKETVDFYVTVWATYKRGSIDTFLGLNTQIDMCWPIALQDKMLFDATLAVSRVAYCMGQKKSPGHDEFMLKHKVDALSTLRSRMMSMPVIPSEAVIFTVSRMLSICYMTSDNAAFEIHFKALERIGQSYMLHKSGEDKMARVVESRLKAWTPLFEYRQGWNPLIPTIHHLALENMQPTRWPELVPDELACLTAKLSPGFRQLVETASLSVETAHLLSELQCTIDNLGDTGTNGEVPTVLFERLHVFRDQPINLLASLELSAFETQLCIALLALTISLTIVYGSTDPQDSHSHGSGITSAMGSSLYTDGLLEKLAKAFLYLKYAGADQSSAHYDCLEWAALVLGSCCFLVEQPRDRVREKGHIALISITDRLLPLKDDDEWDRLAKNLQHQFFWPQILTRRWKVIYLAALNRQREWEGLGLFRLGMPSDDKVEYMVLRDARGALPLVS
ncbi:uncharacterized protein HMPREF1541_09272 [Cyphellophora europaea CBS 101466]|uniref:Transcription factor domain-containing protein n=1 Tax=Cyphellophora europaea (strain CBS 101466) TaxID=1220924 RepID=W2S9P6_CYPE1|nr:uncharacterized protein HMPREF1541_09272 [Cyphellophora europaea CBS 101466]ETN45441.1 hypothetical protein HMPREF1541_09272 [Cyphellophora europaea CBS 101466]